MAKANTHKLRMPLACLSSVFFAAFFPLNTCLAVCPRNSVRCLNESAPGSGLSCLKPWDKRRDPQPRLESEEDDPELIIYVPFTQVRGLACGVGRCSRGREMGVTIMHAAYVIFTVVSLRS